MNTVTVKDFDLQKTLESGQLFSYYAHGNGFVVVASGSVFSVWQHGNTLCYDNCSKEFLTRFFCLDYDVLAFHTHLQKLGLEIIIPTARGIRLLRQDTWETILTFLLSQNSNMQKIQRSLEILREKFGKKVIYRDREYYLMPAFGSMSNYSAIVSSAAGYRSPYLYAANHLATPLWVERLGRLAYHGAKAALMEMPGIGSKVADCICLYGLGKEEAFPIDVWVKRALEEIYFHGKERPLPVLEQFARKQFPIHGGMIQQYLFEWRRLLPK